MRLTLCAALIAATVADVPASNSLQQQNPAGAPPNLVMRLTLDDYVLTARGGSVVVASKADSHTRVFETGPIAAVTQCGDAVCVGGTKGLFRLDIREAPGSIL